MVSAAARSRGGQSQHQTLSSPAAQRQAACEHDGSGRGTIARNTSANANAVRDWRTYADFAQHLIGIARRLYADDPLALELDDTVYALDSTTIDLCLSVFPWAPFRSSKAAIKRHTLLDLRGNIPSFIFISDGKMHDVNILDQLLPEPIWPSHHVARLLIHIVQ